MVGIAFVLAIGAMAGTAANAAIVPTVGLGSAASFSILAGTPVISNTGPTTIDRDVGIYPAASVTGFPPGIVGGTIYAGTVPQAKADLVTAYDDAAGRTPFTVAPGGILGAGGLGGLVPLVAGVYNSGSAILTVNGAMVLDGQNNPDSVWIFQATSSLVTASTSSVTFVRGGSPCNVFWQVTSSASLGSGSSIVGTILALTSITLDNGVTVQGRALARNGDVTLINDTFITSQCSAPTVVVPPTRPPFTIAPSTAPTATPTVAPAATPIATAASSVGPTTAPTAAPIVAVQTAAPAAVAGTQALPSTSTGDPSGPLTMLGVALTGIGILLLRGRAIRHL
jgi:type VI secretion system secreted protein VgrG